MSWMCKHCKARATRPEELIAQTPATADMLEAQLEALSARVAESQEKVGQALDDLGSRLLGISQAVELVTGGVVGGLADGRSDARLRWEEVAGYVPGEVPQP